MIFLHAAGTILVATGALVALAGLIFGLRRLAVFISLALVLPGTVLVAVYGIATGHLVSIFFGPIIGTAIVYTNWDRIKRTRRDSVA